MKNVPIINIKLKGKYRKMKISQQSPVAWNIIAVSFLSGKIPCTGRRWFAYRHRYAYHTLSSTVLSKSASLNENSMGKISPHFKDFQCHLIGTEPIFTDFSANSTQISVEYSYSHILCTHGCFV